MVLGAQGNEIHAEKEIYNAVKIPECIMGSINLQEYDPFMPLGTGLILYRKRAA
jgi:hypothetical protein